MQLEPLESIVSTRLTQPFGMHLTQNKLCHDMSLLRHEGTLAVITDLIGFRKPTYAKADFRLGGSCDGESLMPMRSSY